MALQGHEGARKQHDHDLHEEELKQSIHFLKSNSKLILALMVIILSAFIILAIYKNYQKTITQRAGLQLNQAETTEQLQAVINDFPTADIAPMAQLSLATRNYREGKYDLAAEGYQTFLTNYSDNQLLAPAAELNTAFVLMAQGNLEDALNRFNTFLQKHPDHFLLPYATLSKGMCLEQLGKNSDAKILYEDFLATSPSQAWGKLANENLDALNRRS